MDDFTADRLKADTPNYFKQMPKPHDAISWSTAYSVDRQHAHSYRGLPNDALKIDGGI
jgi:hypothetical protein